MSAKGVLINPTLLAVDLVNMFDSTQTPECTEGTEGYIWVKSIVSNDTYATVTLDIRDHNKNAMKNAKRKLPLMPKNCRLCIRVLKLLAL